MCSVNKAVYESVIIIDAVAAIGLMVFLADKCWSHGNAEWGVEVSTWENSLVLTTHIEITGPQLLTQAVKKRRDFNKDMDEGPYVLLYPDGSQVTTVPGT